MVDLAGGDFVLVWEDRRNADADIYAQRYTAAGALVGANFRVNDDTGRINQFWPSIAALSDGGFVVTWQDNRNGNWDVYAQRYNAVGTAVGANFRVDDDAG